jgi:hypothetical protein
LDGLNKSDEYIVKEEADSEDVGDQSRKEVEDQDFQKE